MADEIIEETVEVNVSSLEAMADNIQKIANVVDQAFGQDGQLTMDAVVTLLQHKLRSERLNRTQIHNVLWALSDLQTYIHGSKK